MPSALDLAAKADQWFGGDLDLRTLSSPASLAKQLLARIGVTPPLVQFGDKGMDRWVAHLSGGWLEANPDYIGRPTPVVPFDLRSAYALSWSLTGMWDLLTADHIEEEEQRVSVFAFNNAPTWALDPLQWKDLGATICEVLPDGEPWPVELGDLHRAYVPLTSKRPMWFPWQTVAAAAILSGKTPNVLSAIKLVPVGQQSLHHLDVLPGLRIRAHKDPVPELVKMRSKYPVLKTVVNSLCWGIMAEFHTTKTTEWPGPWCFPPIAATVAAGPRLLLALLDHFVKQAEGEVIYRDTDSSYCTGDDLDEITCYAEIAAEFDSLDQGWGVWKVSPPCNMLVRDVKKYITFDNHGNLLDWKESNLRGTYEDPPGHPDWTRDYHQRIVLRELGLPVTGPVPTYLTDTAMRVLQNKPGHKPQWAPGCHYSEFGFDSYLTRLRLWHTDQLDQGPKEITVTSIRYKGTASDAIAANREGRALSRTEYGRTCPGCGDLLPEHCRRDKVYCSGRCKKRGRAMSGPIGPTVYSGS